MNLTNGARSLNYDVYNYFHPVSCTVPTNAGREMGVFTHMELGQSTHSAKSFVCPPYLSGKGQLLKLSPRSVRADTSQSSAVLHSPAQLNRMIPMPISNSCLSEQGKCPRNPLIALPD